MSKIKYKDGSIYEGETKLFSKIKHGRGKLVDSQGNVYEGKFENDKKNGYGELFDSLGRAVYKGEWKDDKYNGEGEVHLSITGLGYGAYKGTFENGVAKGQGVFTNSVITCECLLRARGTINGKIKLVYTDTEAKGSVFEGEYNSVIGEAKGKYTTADGSVYNGRLYMFNKNGKGKMKYSDGSVYDGEWSANLYHGKGKITYKDGSVYVGQFHLGKRDGEGTLTFPSGRIISGAWKNDVPEEDEGYGKWSGKLETDQREETLKEEKKKATSQKLKKAPKKKAEEEKEVEKTPLELAKANMKKAISAEKKALKVRDEFFALQKKYDLDNQIKKTLESVHKAVENAELAKKEAEKMTDKLKMAKEYAYTYGTLGSAREQVSESTKSRYLGETNSTGKHGYGTYTLANGDFYEGQFRENRMEGVGHIKKGDYEYIGELKDGKPNGKGIIKSGDFFYKGELCDGEIHNYGEIHYENGVEYIGELCYGKKNGYGMEKEKSGTYEGLFIYGYKGGLCKISACGVEYIGENSKGAPFKYGRTKNKNGEYEGEMKTGEKRLGRRLFDDFEYIGEMIDGEANGYGVIYYKGKLYYAGEIEAYKMHGFGVEYKEKERSFAKFDNSTKQGYGVFERNGEKIPCIFDQNAFEEIEEKQMICEEKSNENY